jgi:hypothetical protein
MSNMLPPTLHFHGEVSYEVENCLMFTKNNIITLNAYQSLEQLIHWISSCRKIRVITIYTCITVLADVLCVRPQQM